MADKKVIPQLVRVKMLKDFKVNERFTAKKGKFGHFDEDVAKKMIKAKAAEEIVAVNSFDDIVNKKPYIVVEEKNPTQEKQEAARTPVVSKLKTKEEKKHN